MIFSLLSSDIQGYIFSFLPPEKLGGISKSIEKMVKEARLTWQYPELLRFRPDTFIGKIVQRHHRIISDEGRDRLVRIVRVATIIHIRNNKHILGLLGAVALRWDPTSKMPDFTYQKLGLACELIDQGRDEILVQAFEETVNDLDFLEDAEIEAAILIPENLSLQEKAVWLREWIKNEPNRDQLLKIVKTLIKWDCRIPVEMSRMANISPHKYMKGSDEYTENILDILRSDRHIPPEILGKVLCGVQKSENEEVVRSVLRSKRPICPQKFNKALNGAIETSQFSILREFIQSHRTIEPGILAKILSIPHIPTEFALEILQSQRPIDFEGNLWQIGLGENGLILKAIFLSDRKINQQSLDQFVDKAALHRKFLFLEIFFVSKRQVAPSVLKRVFIAIAECGNLGVIRSILQAKAELGLQGEVEDLERIVEEENIPATRSFLQSDPPRIWGTGSPAFFSKLKTDLQERILSFLPLEAMARVSKSMQALVRNLTLNSHYDALLNSDRNSFIFKVVQKYKKDSDLDKLGFVKNVRAFAIGLLRANKYMLEGKDWAELKIPLNAQVFSLSYTQMNLVKERISVQRDRILVETFELFCTAGFNDSEMDPIRRIPADLSLSEKATRIRNLLLDDEFRDKANQFFRRLGIFLPRIPLEFIDHVDESLLVSAIESQENKKWLDILQTKDYLARSRSIVKAVVDSDVEVTEAVFRSPGPIDDYGFSRAFEIALENKDIKMIRLLFHSENQINSSLLAEVLALPEIDLEFAREILQSKRAIDPELSLALWLIAQNGNIELLHAIFESKRNLSAKGLLIGIVYSFDRKEYWGATRDIIRLLLQSQRIFSPEIWNRALIEAVNAKDVEIIQAILDSNQPIDPSDLGDVLITPVMRGMMPQLFSGLRVVLQSKREISQEKLDDFVELSLRLNYMEGRREILLSERPINSVLLAKFLIRVFNWNPAEARMILESKREIAVQPLIQFMEEGNSIPVLRLIGTLLNSQRIFEARLWHRALRCAIQGKDMEMIQLILGSNQPIDSWELGDILVHTFDEKYFEAVWAILRSDRPINPDRLGWVVVGAIQQEQIEMVQAILQSNRPIANAGIIFREALAKNSSVLYREILRSRFEIDEETLSSVLISKQKEFYVVREFLQSPRIIPPETLGHVLIQALDDKNVQIVQAILASGRPIDLKFLQSSFAKALEDQSIEFADQILDALLVSKGFDSLFIMSMASGAPSLPWKIFRHLSFQFKLFYAIPGLIYGLFKTVQWPFKIFRRVFG